MSVGEGVDMEVPAGLGREARVEDVFAVPGPVSEGQVFAGVRELDQPWVAPVRADGGVVRAGQRRQCERGRYGNSSV